MHWVASFVKIIEAIYFGSFDAEHIPKKIKRFIVDKNVKAISHMDQ